MTGGLAAVPASTLVDRALAALGGEARSAEWLARQVLGLPNAPQAVAERLVVALLGADPRTERRGDGRWGLVAAARGAPRLEECGFAVVDVETTGMRPASSDRVTEVAVVLVQGTRRELLFDSLLRKDEHFNLHPWVAESWSIPDPVTYVFHLRSGVRLREGDRRGRLGG